MKSRPCVDRQQTVGEVVELTSTAIFWGVKIDSLWNWYDVSGIHFFSRILVRVCTDLDIFFVKIVSCFRVCIFHLLWIWNIIKYLWNYNFWIILFSISRFNVFFKWNYDFSWTKTSFYHRIYSIAIQLWWMNIVTNICRNWKPSYSYQFALKLQISKTHSCQQVIGSIKEN